jgi:hypothetical protein
MEKDQIINAFCNGTINDKRIALKYYRKNYNNNI